MIKASLKTGNTASENTVGKVGQTASAKPSSETVEGYNKANIYDSVGSEDSYVGINNTLASMPTTGFKIGSAVERSGNSFPAASGAKGVTHAIGTTKTAKS